MSIDDDIFDIYEGALKENEIDHYYNDAWCRIIDYINDLESENEKLIKAYKNLKTTVETMLKVSHDMYKV